MAQKQKTNPDWTTLIPVTPGSGPRPQALYRALRTLIETGRLAPGDRLPATRHLAGALGLSRGAAVAAFEMLVADGFAEARTGAGTFVATAVPALAPRPAAPPAGAGAAEPLLLPGTLGVSTPDEQTMALFRRLLNRHLHRPPASFFGYCDARGSADLRAAIADYLAGARGVRCTAEQIVLTSGSQQGLDLIIRTAFRPGDAVWTEDPCYPMARAAFGGAGLVLTGVPVDDEGLDVAAGRRLCPAARAVCVTPSHQFPLGVAMTMRRRLALVAWARETDGWIIEDDYDSEFRYAGAPLTALQGIDDAGRVIYLGSFSKVLFPGLRMGYAVVPEALMAPLMALRARTDRSPSALAEAPLAAFLRQGHLARHLRRARRAARLGRDALVEGLRQGGLAAVAPDQGLHLICPLPPDSDDVALARTARQHGIGAAALSPMFVTAAPRRGLVIGFSGFPAAALHDAGLRLGRLAAGRV
ncbi:PLP-dependent aminotransferase family protein [Pseudoxanthobacter sp.]|uniref:MocR-like pyridoxine biosynthesis transcription factor PdxR n=1 Tax=Pseudoxanthobacter sp. TaxID=1925742 RepID=UPI002FE1DC87